MGHGLLCRSDAECILRSQLGILYDTGALTLPVWQALYRLAQAYRLDVEFPEPTESVTVTVTHPPALTAGNGDGILSPAKRMNQIVGTVK